MSDTHELWRPASSDIERFTSLVLEAPSAAFLSLSIEKKSSGAHAGLWKMSLGKESVILSREQLSEIHSKLGKFLEAP